MTVQCGGAGSTKRTVFVDFSSDEFASFALFYFPEKVVVRQGDTVEFKQTWTGEPHTVTGGSIVNEKLVAGSTWLEFFESYEALLSAGAALPNPEAPGDATVADLANALKQAEPAELRDKALKGYNSLREDGVPLPDLDNPPAQPFTELLQLVDTESNKAFEGLPFVFGEDDQLAQNVSQPCYLRDGMPPEDRSKSCSDANQKQPDFDGTHSYFNSGLIPYEGTGGNTFRVNIADDAKPGTYQFYCAVHGFGQRTEVEVRDADADIPEAGSVARQTRRETKKVTDSLRKIYRDAADDNRVKLPGPGGGTEVEGPFAGLPGEEHTAINEFLPKVIRAKAGEPITWKMMGSDHTISFNVPRYFPIMEFQKSGSVRLNPKLSPAAGGAVPRPEEEQGGGEGPPGDGPPATAKHDGGTFSGTGFWSSGLIGAQPYLEYTMRIAKPGTYRYACLLHPPMVGTVEVT